MKKAILAAWLVSWSGQPEVKQVACPNSQIMTDEKTKMKYIPLCLELKDSHQQKEFKSKKEADEFSSAIRVLVDPKAEVKEQK